MKTKCFAPLFAIAFLLSTVSPLRAAMPKPGDTAPLFQGLNQDGRAFKLSDLIGKKIVLTFFWGQPNKNL